MIQLKGNNRTQDRRLDRIREFDDRSRNFPIRTLIAEQKPRSYTWNCPIWLDQKREGACVGYAFAHEAAARPVKVQGVNEITARKVYEDAKLNDQWPGESYEGTSVLGGAKACVKRGWYTEYRWAFSLDDVLLTIGYHGPVVLGIDWYEGMMDANSIGLIRVAGRISGGHSILAVGVSLRKRLVRLHNSWGKDWGLDGDCYISFDDLDKLLIAQGEACVPIGRKLV